MRFILAASISGVLLSAPGCAPKQPAADKVPADFSLRQPAKERGGTFTAGPWRYVLNITNPGSRSEGAEGRLFFDGRELPMPENLADYYQTPLGRFRHSGQEVGQGRYLWDHTGWLRPQGEQVEDGGCALAWPAR